MTGFLYALADLVLAAILAAAWIAVVFLLGAYVGSPCGSSALLTPEGE